MAFLYPSLISGDLLNLEQQINLLEPHCAGFHLDVMDFHFVPNLTWGPAFINAIRAHTHKRLWVHLMVDNPFPYLERFMLKPHDTISIHYESLSLMDLQNCLELIRFNKLTPSLALSPTTPINVVLSLVDLIDQVLLMSVQPGFSGQALLPVSYERLKALADLRSNKNFSYTIGIDGGVTRENLSRTITYGADDIALASAIFNGLDPLKNLLEFQSLLKQ